MKILMNDLQAETLRKLVLEHKKGCHEAGCDISTFSMLSLWEQLIGRKATTEEFKEFV